MLTGLQVKMTTKQHASQMGNINLCAEVSPSIFAAFFLTVHSLNMTEKLPGLEYSLATRFRPEPRFTETKSGFGIWRLLPFRMTYFFTSYCCMQKPLLF